jgi:hypothetical protein
MKYRLFQVTPTATVSIVDGVIPVRNDGINTRWSFYIELRYSNVCYNYFTTKSAATLVHIEVM